MTALTILDRVNDGDYEGLHPVEYAIPIRPDSRKAKEIEQVMGHVRKKVRQNANESRSAFNGQLHMDTGLRLSAFPAIEKEYEKLFNDNLVDGNLSMAITQKNLNSIMEGDGRFKNQFEIMTSNGVFAPDIRAEQSKRNFGTRPGKIKFGESKTLPNGKSLNVGYKFSNALKNSEKYGFPRKYSKFEDLDQYGDYSVDFNVDNVKNRVTMTNDDSLDKYIYPVLLDEPSTWPGMLGTRLHVRSNYTTGCNPVYNATKPIGSLDNRKRSGYSELQYHGPLGLDDVERLHVPKIVDESGHGVRSQVRSDIPDQWIMQAEINNFDIVDDQGNLIYQCSAHKGKQ